MAALPEPWKSLRAAIEKMQARLRALENRSPFFGTGMHPNGEGGIDSDNFVAGTSGYSFGSDGNAEFNSLTLRGGIIGNDALTNPSKAQAIYATTSNFGLSTSLANVLTANLTVPAGFTSASISVVTRVYIVNPHTTGGYDSAGGDYLFGQANIAGFNGYAFGLAVSGNNGSGTNVSPFSAVLTGLTPGGSVLVQEAASTGFAALAASANNVAEISGSVTWYR